MDRRELFDDPIETARMAQDGAQARIWTSFPGICEAIDLVAQTCSIQPCIQGAMESEAGEVVNVNLPLLVDVPIVWPRAGGFAITFPVKVGDECLVHVASRCIDAWWQSGGIQAPIEDRMHDLSDSFACFGPTSQPRKLADVQSDGMELRNDARTVWMKFTDTNIQINGDVIHTGKYDQTGDYTQTGNYTLNGSMVHGGGTVYSLGRRIDGVHTHISSKPGDPTSIPNP